MSPLEPLDPATVRWAVAAALEEDRALGDVSTLATVEARLEGRGAFLAKADGVIAGLDLAGQAFRQLDASTAMERRLPDGSRFSRGAVVAEVAGPVRALLQAERVALNFLQRLSGVATLTRKFVEAVEGTNTAILDTRKTTPLLRDLEKYAVRCGGGRNHRRDLASMAMLKDNHLAALRRQGRHISDGVAAVRRLQPGIAVEVEITSLDELEEALAASPEWILLDNMSVDQIRRAVDATKGRAHLEASGGVTLSTVRTIAETGVDAISVGALTHSAPALDLSLELEF